MRILNQVYVDHDISVENLDYIIGNISVGNIISFNDEEIPSRGRENYKALHITTKCKGCTVAKVLLDNGSSLNVMHMRTLARLPINMSYMRKSQMIVRAFDGTRREVVGDIEIPVEIGPCTFTIEFQVMHIAPSYNYWLGRPWIHMAGAIPLSLHQKAKFIVEGKIVCVNREEDLLISKPTYTPYMEAVEEVPECSFRSFEFVNTTYVGEGTTPPIPRLSKTTKMAVNQIVGKGYRAGAGLGRELQGIRKPIRATKNEEMFGLGYKPTKKEREEMIAERRKERLARFKGHELEIQGMTYPHLYETFRSRGEEQSGNVDGIPTTYLGPPNLKLSSWTTMSLPVTCDSISKIPNNKCEDDNDSGFEVNFGKGTSVSELDDTENVEDYDLTPNLLRLVEQEGRQIVPYQETLETINLGNEENKKEVRIGMTLVSMEKEKLRKLLHEYVDVFAWSYQDMTRLNTDIIAHKLPLKPECKPIKQKLRRMKPEMMLKIKEEVKKQFDAGFLEVVKYPEWVANIVPVPKKDGKVRMCVDYRDLNRAISKDNFPLPHIDTLVDNTAHHSMFSFMDGFSGYNQTKMAPEDREKTTFITMWGTFCYKVMPFGLKNAGVTYQRAMVTLFHDMMHREVEVYVDDMIVKARKTEDHATNLERLFKMLRKFQLRLNPAKCTFGVTSGKLLGFIVSERGIEVDLDKVQAIHDLPLPKTQKEVRGFLGRLNYIARFISQLTLKCDPIFKLLRKHNPGAWNEECQVAFDKVKEYLLSPPVLVPSVVGRPLLLYLTVNKGSMGCVLGQYDEPGKKERAVYYLSKKFTEYESKYSSLKKMCCALAWTAHRLRQYMLYHTTWLIAKFDHIKYIFEKPSLSGRVARWQVLLFEYDIVYVSQKVIKGSAIADFLAEMVEKDYEPMEFEFLDEDLMSICQTSGEK
ncbi:G-patch domain - like 1 [Theobroma cacao]|nr:G-patch domain - like 1 [Theobroma cacao]